MTSLRLLIFCTMCCIAIQAQASTHACEDEVNTLEALSRVLKVGLRLGEIKPAILEQRILGPTIDNPFIQDGKNIGNLALSQKFASHFPRLKETSHEDFRNRVRDLIAIHQTHHQSVAAAKDATKYILGVTAEEIPYTNGGESFVQGVFQGRPVFVGSLKEPREFSNIYLVDYFRSDKTFKRYWTIPRKGRSALNYGAKIFEWRGQTYIGYFRDARVFNLESGREVDFGFPSTQMLPPSSEELRCRGGEFTVTDDGIRYFSAWKAKEKDSTVTVGLGFAEFISKTPEFKFLTTEESTYMQFKLSYVNGQTLLPYVEKINPSTMHLFDLSKGQNYSLKPANPEVDFNGQLGPPVFSRNGRIAVAAVIRIPNRFQHKLMLFDVGGNEMVQEIETGFVKPTSMLNSSSMNLLEDRGRQYIFLQTPNALTLIDVQTLKPLWSLSAEYENTFGQFQFLGEPYLLMGTKTGAVHIIDLLTGKVLNRVQVSDKGIRQIFTFEVDGMPMAFLPLTFGKKPLFLRLMKEEKL